MFLRAAQRFAASVRHREEVAQSPVPAPCLSLVLASPVPSPSPNRTPAPVFRLYPEPERPAVAHARALMELLREQCPEAVGSWLLASDLSRTYAELSSREGWTELSWCSIGRELGKLTRRRTVKRQGRRYIAYMLR